MISVQRKNMVKEICTVSKVYYLAHLRSQRTPSPIKPSRHLHVNDPGKFVHSDKWAHFELSSHSFMSVKEANKPRLLKETLRSKVVFYSFLLCLLLSLFYYLLFMIIFSAAPFMHLISFYSFTAPLRASLSFRLS